jgi:hypothetical protein
VRRNALVRLGIVIGCAAAIVLLTAAALRPGRVAGPCAVIAGPAMLPDVPETSGLAISRRVPGVVWSHNDSGHAAVLFAIDSSGTVRGRVRVPVRTRDWEDVSAARCPSGDCLYIADIGDNARERRRIVIARVPEPSPTDSDTAAPEVFSATYADGRHNAEAMFVLGDDLFIVTRDRVGGIYHGRPSDARKGKDNDIVFTRVGQLGLPTVTDAEASPDEKTIVVRTSGEAVLYAATDFVRGKYSAIARIPLDGLKEPQGEGVARDGQGNLYLSSEGGPWNRAGRLLKLRCSP